TNHPCFLQQRNELRGRYASQLRVGPSQQRLRAGYHRVGEAYLGLVMELERALGDGLPQPMLDRQAAAEGGADALLVDEVRLVERRGAARRRFRARQRLRGVAPPGVEQRTHAGADAQLSGGNAERSRKPGPEMPFHEVL